MEKKGTLNLTEYGSLISFVPAKRDNTSTEANDRKLKHKDEDKLSGKEAKTFYEDLLNETSERAVRTERRKRKSKTPIEQTYSKQKADVTNHHCEVAHSSDICKTSHQDKTCSSEINSDKYEKNMLFYSQTGDLEMLLKLFKSSPNMNINYQDSFGWTALMCAAVSGHRDVVDHLLKKGADRFICDSQNQTVCDLTTAQGNRDMTDRITNYLENNQEGEESRKINAFFCDKCNTTFKETSLKEHQTSTLHLFNMNLKVNVDSFMIPRSNIGYRIMTQSGWDGKHGLGPQGKGHKLPVKTVLKRNRFCLGSNLETNKKRITHFGPYDTNATVSANTGCKRLVSAATSSRRERRKRERKEKEWERNLRSSMDF